MANEKVYVGEDGAKELYRKIKALIPGAVTVVDYVSLESMSAVTSHAVALAIGNLTGFQTASGTGDNNYPNVPEPNTRTIYLVKIDDIQGEDKYKEWIWVEPSPGEGSWECIGSTSMVENAWKQWSEDNGSTGIGNSVYLGANNTLTRSDAYALGNGNTALITDETDYSNTDVLLLGTSNSATNAANAYQIGQHNTVIGNNLASKQYYPHQTAVNLGVYNTVTLEGVNIGKDNSAERFGVSIGQGNSSCGGSVAIGQDTIAGLNSGREGAFAFGSRAEAYAGSLAIGIGISSGKLIAGLASSYSGGGSLVVGIGELYAYGGSVGIGMAPSVPTVAAGQDPVAPASVSGGSFGIIGDNISTDDSSGKRRTVIGGQSIGVGSRNVVSGSSIVFGSCVNASGKSFVVGRESTDIQDEGLVFGVRNNKIGSLPGPVTIAGSEYPYGFSGQAMAIGYGNQQIASKAVAVGYQNSLAANKAMVVGIDNSQVRDEAFAVGISCDNVYSRAFAIGNYVSQVSGGSIGIGHTFRNITENSISIGTSNSGTNGASIAIGLSNTAKAGSVVMGIGNSAKGGAVMFGIGNYSDTPSQELENVFTTNGMIVGLGNRSYNIRSAWQSGDMLSRVNTFGCSVGAYIMSYGHNAIAFGMGHIVGDPSNWMNDTAVETDNDGFMTAIGYKCEALRNYDFALGYKSKAKGGENVAIGHSEAIGFRNYAFNQSKIKGVTNIGILDSELVTPIENIYSRGKGYTDEAYNVRNFLFHSKLTHSPDPIYGPNDTEHTPNYHQYILTDNICLHSTPTLMHGGNYGFNGNLFAMDRGIMISAANASNNIIWKMYTKGNDSVNVTSTMCRNISIGSKLDISGTHNYTNNITLGGCSVEIGLATGTVNIDSNIVHNSIFRGYNFGHQYGYTCRDNVVLSNSVLDFSNDYVDDNSSRSATFNMVLNGSGLRTYIDETSYWYGGHQPTKSNVLFGTHAFGILGCFSHSDTVSAERSGDYNLFDTLDSTFKSLELTMGSYSQQNNNAYLKNARFATNFGDNALKDINTALVTGESNFVRGVHCAVVHGSANNLINANNSNDGSEALPFISVIGNENRIKNTGYGTYFNHNWVEGNKNWVYGSKIADTRVHGTRNSVTGLDQYNIPSLTLTEITTIQNQYRSGDNSVLRGLFKAAESGTVNYYNSLGKVSTSTVTAGTVYSFKIIDKDNGDRVGINCETASCRTSSLGTSIFYDPTPFDLAHDIYKVTIFGEQNTVTSRIAGYSIFGSGNLIRNTLNPSDPSFCIGNGFIQGNNNTIQNGSNIISMGNGNVSSGHNSVAIGSQLISDQWQTVIGKYNIAIDGPNRLASETPQDSTKALFIVGNGYSTKDDKYWQDETYITRSNALELYADGRLKISGAIEASNIPQAPSNDGHYALTCDVVNGEATYRWVAIGTSNL